MRSLAIDAVESAQSGHPGLPLGLAELGALLFAEVLSYNPDNPQWFNRDRLVLSAGHGSMLLYALLHLSGYDLPLAQLKQFRQLHSQTPGHPEYGLTPGVETTTGPLGQGLATAVGMALSEAHLNALFHDEQGALIDHFIYVIASDGDLMEGLSAEASSLAGHLRFHKLIVFYDDNHISIEGDTNLAFSENVEQRYSAYGWQTLSADAYTVHSLRRAIQQAQSEKERPTLIRVQSIIGYGSPNKAGSAAVHGSPLGSEEAEATRQALGLTEQFFIHPQVTSFFEKRRKHLQEREKQWHKRLKDWLSSDSQGRQRWERYHSSPALLLKHVNWPTFRAGEPVATRKASGALLKAITEPLPQLIGGSADLAPSNNTAMPGAGDFSAANRHGRVLHFGVREHAMAAITNGIALHGPLVPFCATFLVFSDYMRGAMRLAALMKLPVIYVLSHDSIYLGEDGPTHQPIEHLAALRAIPGMHLLRPADAQETIEAWRIALEERTAPTIIALSRQGLPIFDKHDRNWHSAIRRGAYIVLESQSPPECIVVATGSEVSLALEAAHQYGAGLRVISMISREIFEMQDEEYRHSLFPSGVRVVVVEAAARYGWEHYVSRPSDLLVLSDFGASAPGKEVAAHCGLTSQELLRRLKS